MDDIDFIEDEINAEKTRKAHTRKVGKQKIVVRSSVEKAKDDYKEAKRIHKDKIRGLKRNIKTHKLMIKQAKNTYKIIKLGRS